MKYMTFLVAAGLAVATLAGCSIPSKEESSAHSQQVVIPWWSQGSYKWESVTLHSMKNLSALDGLAAKFFLSPSSRGKSLIGTQPRVRSFINKSGSAVLTDELSQHMVTLYAHIEKLQEMDERLGVGSVLSKPRVVGVHVLQADGGSNNALYSPKYDALLFLPYRGRDLPIIVNAGAVAHEHFHALFQALVVKDIQTKVDTMALVSHLTSHPEEKDISAAFGLSDEEENEKIINELEERSRYHSFLLRAINEGLADVWGWLYTGDANFIQKTWPKLSERNMSAGTGPIAAREVIRAQSLHATERGKEDVSQAYALGTSYARLIRALFDKGGNRDELAQKILVLMGDLKKEILDLGEEAWLSPSIIPALLANKVSSKADCDLLLSFAVVSELDANRFNCSRFDTDPLEKVQQIQGSNP